MVRFHPGPPKMKTATQSRAYRAFTNDRNRALERLHLRAQAEINDLLRGALNSMSDVIRLKIAYVEPEARLTKTGSELQKSLEAGLLKVVEEYAPKIAGVIETLKRLSFALGLVGEAEGIALATGNPVNVDADLGRIQAAAKDTEQGDDLRARVMLALLAIRRDVIGAFEKAWVLGEGVPEALERVRKAMPGYRLLKQPKKPLQRVKEAGVTFLYPDDEDLEDEERDTLARLGMVARMTGEGAELTATSGFIDDQTWAHILEWYSKEYKPLIRIDGALVDPRSPTFDREFNNEQFYSWQVEQLTTHEFVRSIRSGQNDAANQAGITDMVWIAVVDDKTDECCLWRDGLSSEEIESKLSTSHKDDECRVAVPPAHFNCRCDIAPLLKDMPEVEQSNAPEFEEWLQSK